MGGKATAQDKAADILKSGTWGVLCTAEGDSPYGVPVNYYYSAAENAIFFHCGLNGKKLDILRRNPNVSFTVVAEEKIIQSEFTTHYESAIASGRAYIIEDGAEKVKRLIELCGILAPGTKAARDAMIQKHIARTLIVRINIDQLSGKSTR